MVDNYVANVIPHIQTWWNVIIILIYTVGIILTVAAAAQAISQKHKYNKSIPLWTFYSAILLLNLPALLDALSMTVFNASSEQTLSYTPPGHPGQIYVQFATYAIMTVGLIGTARGVSLLRDSPAKPSNLSRAVIHFFGGIIAINIVQFLRGIGATLGGDIQSYITTIIG